MLCLIKVNSYIIELTVHTSSKCVLVLLCVKLRLQKVHLIFISSYWTLKHCDKTNDGNIMSNKLLNISLKLKEDKYISIIIKESRQFFIDE